MKKTNSKFLILVVLTVLSFSSFIFLNSSHSNTTNDTNNQFSTMNAEKVMEVNKLRKKGTEVMPDISVIQNIIKAISNVISTI